MKKHTVVRAALGVAVGAILALSGCRFHDEISVGEPTRVDARLVGDWYTRDTPGIRGLRITDAGKVYDLSIETAAGRLALDTLHSPYFHDFLWARDGAFVAVPWWAPPPYDTGSYIAGTSRMTLSYRGLYHEEDIAFRRSRIGEPLVAPVDCRMSLTLIASWSGSRKHLTSNRVSPLLPAFAFPADEGGSTRLDLNGEFGDHFLWASLHGFRGLGTYPLGFGSRNEAEFIEMYGDMGISSPTSLSKGGTVTIVRFDTLAGRCMGRFSFGVEALSSFDSVAEGSFDLPILRP